jgi:lysophospholipase L1-like esterase
MFLSMLACGAPTRPTLMVSCPSNQTMSSPDGNPVTVGYTAPVVSGGTAPVSTTCVPPSGSKFPLGLTSVNCTVRDAAQQTAACRFDVSIAFVPPVTVPRLGATRFVAFGDSITEGFEHACSGSLTMLGATLDDYWRQLVAVRPPPPSPIAYPAKLRDLLAARYTAQTFTIVNEGSGGETIEAGAADLSRVLTQDAPEVVLIQEGTNDMDAIAFGADPGAQMATVVTKLRDMIRLARARGVVVFAGTLTPQRPGACRGYAPAFIGPVNERIRVMVAGEDATLVDIYSAFGGVASTDLIGPDGLHPSAAGYQKIADTFFDVIRRRLEI